MKKITSIFMAAVIILSTFIFGAFSASAASNPSFGSAPTSIDLYVNDNNNDSRAINIKISNWKSGYTYKAFSSNTSVATVVDASVNSKSGVLFTIQSKRPGSANITVQMCKSGKVIQSKYIAVKVYCYKQATPTSLKVTPVTSTSLKVTYSLSNRNFITGYQIQISTNPHFTSPRTYIINSKSATTVTFTGMQKGTRYYVRVASYSNLNGYENCSGFVSASGTTGWTK